LPYLVKGLIFSKKYNKTSDRKKMVPKVEKMGKGKIIEGVSSQFYHRSFTIAVFDHLKQSVP